jgi:AcrR family transcriptional regulator
MTARPGRPQDEAIRRRILAAAVELLGRGGAEACTFEAIATRANTSRPAIYRRWSRMDDLIAEAINTGRPHLVAPDTGALESDLRLVVADFLEQYGTPLAKQAVLEILRSAVQGGSAAGAWAERYGTPRIDEMRSVFSKAIERAELTPDADVDTIMYVMSSTLLQAILLGEVPELVRAGVMDRVVDLVLAVARKG